MSATNVDERPCSCAVGAVETDFEIARRSKLIVPK